MNSLVQVPQARDIFPSFLAGNQNVELLYIYAMKKSAFVVAENIMQRDRDNKNGFFCWYTIHYEWTKRLIRC